MPRQIALSIALALSSVSRAVGQAATTTANPLNSFINGAQQGAGAIQSAAAKQSPTSSASSSTSSVSPTSSSTSPTAAPAASSAAAAASHGLSNGAKIGIIVGCVVGVVIIGAIIAGLCCCMFRRRRHRRRAVTPIADEEVKSWKHHPTNPGRNYSPVAQNSHRSMEQHPTVPLMAAAAMPHGSHNQPSLSQHPANRQQNEDPFVTAPLGPRLTAPNSRAGLTDGTVPGASPYVLPEKRHLQKSYSRSRSNSRPGSAGRRGLPTHTSADRPSTPFGLSGIGRPYDDTHVHVLQTDAPSRELRRSLGAREHAFPAGIYDDSDHHQYRNSRGYSTPPEAPSRSPNREKHPSTFADSSYDSSVSSTTGASASSREQYRRQSDPYQPAQRDAVAPWEQHRLSGTPPTSATMTPPPVPWENNEYSQQRRHSHSPKQSRNSNTFVGADGRRSSGSPATSINGQTRRLRFEDLQAAGTNPAAQHESQVRWSQGVGEAL